MAPVYESDLAEERWQEAEWRNFEFWEKVEARLKRRRSLWVASAFLTALSLLAIPVVRESGPRWRAMGVARRMTEELSSVKREAALLESSLRVHLEDRNGSVQAVVEKLQGECSAAQAVQILRTVELSSSQQGVSVLTAAQGRDWGLTRLVDSWCFSPWVGVHLASPEADIQGFAFLPQQDVSSNRSDRMAIALSKGIEGELSFE